MQYKKSDFDNLLINPLCSEKSIVGKYPILELIISEEYSKSPLLDGLLRYIIMLYDDQSILLRDHKNLITRKSIALELAGLNKQSESVKNSILNNDKIEKSNIVIDLTMAYLIQFAKCDEFIALQAIQFKYYESIKELLSEIIGDTNKERLDAAQKNHFLEMMFKRI